MFGIQLIILLKLYTMHYTIHEIAQILGGKFIGNGQERIYKLANLQDAAPGSISFLANPRYQKYLYTTKASAVIISQDLEIAQPITPILIRVSDPYTSFSILLQRYQAHRDVPKLGVEAPSYIGEATTCGEGIYRGAFSYIGNQVHLGKSVQIYPQVYIGDQVEIGDHTIIYSGARIYAGTQIGRHCIIHAGAVLGSDGFGFAKQQDGSYSKIPHLGKVILEDHVEIGANTTIDRATLGQTCIKQGSKIDNLVQIAHNVEVGEHTIIAAQAGIAGSAIIGPSCQLGGQTGIAGHITIGANTAIGGQAGVTKSYTKGSAMLMGTPAFERKNYVKSYAWFKQLPFLAKRLALLESLIANKIKM
jgi:UDP-3-O-[3-hydroxymyristoyl] glucosamine N-acyltransferase